MRIYAQIGKRFYKSLITSLLFILLVAPLTPLMHNVEAHNGLLLSAFDVDAPFMDGDIGSSEWEDADTTTFGPFTAGAKTITGTVYMMNDESTLYMAVEVNGDDDLDMNAATLFLFDNDNGGETSHEEGDDGVFLYGSNSKYDTFYRVASSGFIFDTSYGGTAEIAGSAGRHSGVNHFELSHPLDTSDDAHDFSLSNDDIVGFCLYLWIDSTAYDLSSYGLGTPGNPSTFADYQVLLPILSAFTPKAPIIDGIMEPGEWGAADSKSFDLDGHTGTLYVMNDAINIYFLFKVTDDDTDTSDHCRINFDNDNGGGSLVTGDDSLVCDSDGFDDNYYDSGTLSNEDSSDGGTLDGEGIGQQDGSNTWYFEFSHPLDSADDSHDFSLSIGDTVGFCLYYWDYYSGGNYFYYWPTTSYDEDNYGDIIIAKGSIGMLNFHDYSNRMGSMTGITPSSTLYFPHFDRGSSWSTFYTIVNPQTSSASIDVTYYASDGTTIDTDSFSLDPGHKTGTFSATGNGWIKVESDVPIVGMLNFHDYSNRMGSMPGVTPSSTLFFPHFDKGSSWSTFYTIVNPQTSSTDVEVAYYASDGSTISTSMYTLPAGHKTGTFPPTGSGWIRVESDLPIVGMLNFHDYSNRMGSMPGVSPSSTLYFPHYDKGSSWSTFYTIVNPQASSASIDVTYYGPDGSTIDTSSYTLPAGHKTGTFPPTGSGWIKVESDVPIVGMLNFHDYSNRMGSMPGVSPSSTLYFPHYDKGSSWSSYGAIVNPEDSTTSVTTTFYNNDGAIVSSGTDSVDPLSKIGGYTPTGSGWIKVEAS